MADTPVFEPVSPTSRKVRCVACGEKGYIGGRWMDKHRAGHPFPCPEPSCSRVFANQQALAGHVSAARRGKTARHW